MTMTRQHFALIAEAMRDAFQCFPRSDEASRNAVEKCCRLLARELGATNGRFDRARFLRACGVDDA